MSKLGPIDEDHKDKLKRFTKWASKMSDAKDSVNAGILCLFEAVEVLEKTCKWNQDSDGNWETECDNLHYFAEGNWKENQYQFCPYCRGIIK